jgi:hypothetical protein
VQLEPGQTLDLGDVAIPAMREFQGRCEHVDGKGRLSVEFTPLDAVAHPALRPGSTDPQVAEDGTFKVRLAEGRYAVRASGAGGAVATIDTRALAGPIVLNLAGEAPIRLDAKTGGEVLELAIVDAGGRDVFRRWLQDGWKFPLLALPGDYRVELKDRSGKVASRLLHLGADGVDLRVP